MVPHFAGRVGPGWDQLGARTPPERKDEVDHYPLTKRPMVFASDTPFDPEKGPGYIRETIANLDGLGLSEGDRQTIYADNARKLFGVSV